MPKQTSYSAPIAHAALALCGALLLASSPAHAQSASTAGVKCAVNHDAFNASIGLTSTYNWSCDNVRNLVANGIPDHPSTGGRFATPISAQRVAVRFPLTPELSGKITPLQDVGYVLNGVKIEANTAGSCPSDATSTKRNGGCVMARGRDPWNLEAMGGAFVFGTDSSNAHVQPNGAYHYHGVPEDYLVLLGKGKAMTLVGFAVDGFPLYARYGYTSATDAKSAIKVVTPSWKKKATPEQGRPSTETFPMGTFTQDYEYVAGSGDLDECNGRFGVTPEFPNGIYHYFLSDAFPFGQRCVKGRI